MEALFINLHPDRPHRREADKPNPYLKYLGGGTMNTKIEQLLVPLVIMIGVPLLTAAATVFMVGLALGEFKGGMVQEHRGYDYKLDSMEKRFSYEISRVTKDIDDLKVIMRTRNASTDE